MPTPTREKSILFIEKVFLRPVTPTLRGVELFNLQLILDLAHLGHTLTLPAHPSWRRTFETYFSGEPRIHPFLPHVRFGPFKSLAGRIRLAGFLASHPRFDILLIGNVGNLLIPFIHILRLHRRFHRFVLIAHRETSRRFLRTLRNIPGTVLAVNKQIAAPFLAADFPSVHVDYGVMHAGRFHPGTDSDSKRTHTRFCVVGNLDNKWKGADTAIAAFRLIPDSERARAELHLASYSTPPRFEEADIVPYSWMPASDIPEWLRGMDVMICPSHDEGVMRETFSQAIVQGMLTGLPILASNLPIFAEKLDVGGGHIFTSVEDLAEKMRQMIRHPEKRRSEGIQGCAVARERYIWDTERFSAYLTDPTLEIRPSKDFSGLDWDRN